MSTVLFLVFLFLAIYAAASLLTVIVDFKTGRYRRLKRLRSSMDEARREFESRQNRSDKFWESLPSE